MEVKRKGGRAREERARERRRRKKGLRARGTGKYGYKNRER